jgi:hypothetical protein
MTSISVLSMFNRHNPSIRCEWLPWVVFLQVAEFFYEGFQRRRIYPTGRGALAALLEGLHGGVCTSVALSVHRR